MAYPASTALLDKTLDQIDGIMLMIRGLSQTLRNSSAAGPIAAESVVQYMARVADLRDNLAALAAVPGLAEFAKTAKQNPTLDIVAEYQATVGTIDATRAWITTNFPKAADGSVSEKKFDANGRTVPNTFASASLAGLRTQLDALIASIA